MLVAAVVSIGGGCGRDPEPVDPAPAAAAPVGCGDVTTDTTSASGIEIAETVGAVVETEPVASAGDAADDAAIWVNHEIPERSAIIGTDKRGGIAVYGLDGSLLHERADGELNNVDLRCDHLLLGERATIVTAGNRTDNTIAIYRLDPNHRRLDEIAEREIQVGVSTYGSCMYRDADTEKLYYFATSHEGDVEQWELFSTERGTIDGRKVRSFAVGSTAEACVADDVTGDLYISEEARGVWRLGARPDDEELPTLIAAVEEDGGQLVPDVEGLALVRTDRGALLFVSSQGDDSFVVYELARPHELVGRFEIADAGAIDGVENTDGIAVVAADLGPSFQGGLLVVQDGENDGGNQNYKLVSLARILGVP